MKHVTSDYLNPAIETVKMLNFSSELGLALCFDIHVQDGGILHAALDQIRQQVTPDMPETTRRVIVANAVADSARPAFRQDVRQRKLTIATGEGVVHGHTYNLDEWGLNGGFQASELAVEAAQAAGQSP
jgi:hypothetical protein